MWRKFTTKVTFMEKDDKVTDLLEVRGSAAHRIFRPQNRIRSEDPLFRSQRNSTVNRLTWTFNQPQTIVTQTGSEPVYSKSWRRIVRLSADKSLVLKDWTGDRLGLYSCQINTDKETLIIHTELKTAETDKTHLKGNLCDGSEGTGSQTASCTNQIRNFCCSYGSTEVRKSSIRTKKEAESTAVKMLTDMM
ncbi:hypothetical protein WMY93_031743 [Mugilogobius chulae]|uniref:Ig-like domain-containing protein n=1 Tax=Mugilogobius chulae TaxID=88201 RepID=A0AAW0MF10_9GOBI